jgi:hypothetical protein
MQTWAFVALNEVLAKRYDGSLSYFRFPDRDAMWLALGSAEIGRIPHFDAIRSGPESLFLWSVDKYTHYCRSWERLAEEVRE